MKTYSNYSNYGNDLFLTKQDALRCSHSGQCDSDVLAVSKKRYIKEQIKGIDPEQLRKELKEFGAWDYNELLNHEENIQRWIWISACDISERDILITGL